MRRFVAALAAVLVLTGCTDEADPPGRSNIDVDTPELRDLKADAGIEPCEPGPGGGELPAITLECLGGGDDVDLSSLTGPMLINLWNTACDPCRDEMPALQQFHETYGGTVPVLGLDVTDTQPEMAISFAEMVGATYPQLADPGGEIFDQDDVVIRPAFPQFIVLDETGTATVLSPGGLDSLAEVVELVEDTLGINL